MNPFRVISQRKVLSLTQWSSKTLPESHPQSNVDQVVWTAVKFNSKSTACPSVCEVARPLFFLLSLQDPSHSVCFWWFSGTPPSPRFPSKRAEWEGVPWNQPPLLQSHTLFFQESPDLLVTAAERGRGVAKGKRV